jgi:hypothetical protein
VRKDPCNCTMRLTALADIWAWKGPFDVDVFASPLAVAAHPTTKVQLDCVSPFVMPQRLHCDAFSFNDGRRLYAFPPTNLIGKYIRFILSNNCKCVLIVPEWPTQFWWPLVVNRHRMCLGSVSSCIKAGQSGLPHPFGGSFDAKEALKVILHAVVFNM